MRCILFAVLLFIPCTIAGAQEQKPDNEITSWSDYVSKITRTLLKTEGSRISDHKDVTIFSSGTNWSFYTDPAHGKYAVVILYMPRFVPAPTVSFGYPNEQARLEDKEFSKVEDKNYGMKILRVSTGKHNLATLRLTNNGKGESSTVTILIVEYQAS